MKVTIKKIAEIAGVHPATVDKVLHNRPGVSDEVRERVQKLIDELGYKPNPAGRVLQQQGKEFIIAAILVKVDALPYIRDGIEKGIREQTGLDIKIHWYLTSYSDAGQQAQYIDKAVEEKADGIIISPITSNRVREAINRASDAGIPVIVANSDIEGTRRLCYVGQDGLRASRVAGRTMGNFLRGRGRIAIISSGLPGVIAGIVISLLVLFLGKDKIQGAVLKTDLPVPLRKLFPMSSFDTRLEKISDQVRDQFMESLTGDRSEEITDRMVSDISGQIEDCLVRMAQIVEIPLG